MNFSPKSSPKRFDEINEVLIPDTQTYKPISRTSFVRSLFRLYYWICTHKVFSVIISFLVIPMILYTFLLALSNSQALLPLEFQKNVHRVLLVVAHPDDECLFFSPTIRVLRKQAHLHLNLLVFSRGNHVGLGERRANELSNSCQVFNIPREHCLVLDLPNIQDNPKVWWSEQELIPILTDYINKWSIDVLVSFDHGGISGHLNHRSVASAVRLLTRNMTNTKIRMSYELKSVSLLRKYSSIVDFYLIFISFVPRLFHSLFATLIPFNLISSPDLSSMLLINTPMDYMISRNAFAQHESQYSWDRYLYLIASRYMFVNEMQYIEK